MGAGFEWKDDEGKTPLILACLRHDLFDVAKTLIELGANINAYRPGRNGGTPLHHATMKGHEKIIKLLLASGANPFVRNGDGHNALDLARKRGRFVIVRAIESHLSIFSGWLRAECGSVMSSNFSPISSDFRPGKVWVTVLPCDLNDPPKFELAIYLAPEVAEPLEIIQISESTIEPPNFNKADPSLIIETFITKYRLFSEYWGEKQKIYSFYNACRGITVEKYIDMSPELVRNMVSTQHDLITSNPSIRVMEISSIDQEEKDLDMALKASIHTAIAEGLLNPNSISPQAGTMGSNTNDQPIISTSKSSRLTMSKKSSVKTEKKEEKEKEKGVCVICLDKRVEAACVPCGHMAGCMKCLKKIEAKNKKCPVCRANVDQVIKIYTV
ncbi:hypothetical protein LUZ60_002304 [Juncus effusus]|nr:hypothetical protein LUZ60_002304 [Juncus effusus]